MLARSIGPFTQHLQVPARREVGWACIGHEDPALTLGERLLLRSRRITRSGGACHGLTGVDDECGRAQGIGSRTSPALHRDHLPPRGRWPVTRHKEIIVQLVAASCPISKCGAVYHLHHMNQESVVFASQPWKSVATFAPPSDPSPRSSSHSV